MAAMAESPIAVRQIAERREIMNFLPEGRVQGPVRFY